MCVCVKNDTPRKYFICNYYDIDLHYSLILNIYYRTNLNTIQSNK